jgi:HEAT repeat protein
VLACGVTSLLPLVMRWADHKNGRAWVEPLARRYPGLLMPVVRSLLRHPDPAVRAGSLWTVAPASIGADQLRGALEDPDPTVRVAACYGIGVIGDSAAAGILAGLLDGGDALVRTAAADALTRLPRDAHQPYLAERLELTTDDSVLVAALAALAATPCPAVEERVLHLAGQVSGSIRRVALRAVARISGPRAEVLLFRALADGDPGLQVEALDLLVGRGGDQVYTTLLALLSVGDSLRYHVIRALGRLGQAQAVGPLRTLFPSAPLHERIEILTALSRLGGKPAREFLGQCLDQPRSEIRRVAAQGLAALAEPEDLELIGRLARDHDWVVRSEAAQGFGRLRAGPAHPLLLDLARDLEPAVARAARAALAER